MIQPKVLYQYKECAGKLFCPSNGTEGDIFMGAFCERCIHEKYTHTGNDNDKMCDIISSSMAFDIKDELYPKEWKFNDEGWPICTNWVKWDWGNDDEGWNDPPEEPPPIDINQLDLFPLYIGKEFIDMPITELIKEANGA